MRREQPVAVVIPSWNSIELLPRCVGSLGDQDVDLELLVVDNGSTDGSLGFLKEQGVPHVALPKNVGFAAAVNLAAARTVAEALLVLNADTVLRPGCIGRLFESLVDDPSLGGVQPRILQAGSSDGFAKDLKESSCLADANLYSAGQALTKDGRALELGMGTAQSAGSLVRREIFGVCGAACLLRRELFSHLGGYDERYFAFYEDVDLNVRARASGWRFDYVPEAVVWHIGNASWQAGFRHPAAENARLVARNRLATQIKFMPLRSLPRVALVEAGALVRAALQRRLFATLRGKLEVLRWCPALLRERRQIGADGGFEKVRKWLGKTAIPSRGAVESSLCE